MEIDFEKILEERDFDKLYEEYQKLDFSYFSADKSVRYLRDLYVSRDKKLKALKKYVEDLSGENEEYAKISDILSIIE